jgi:hypothetical protein
MTALPPPQPPQGINPQDPEDKVRNDNQEPQAGRTAPAHGRAPAAPAGAALRPGYRCVGKDNKGRQLVEGPGGGRYYINGYVQTRRNG